MKKILLLPFLALSYSLLAVPSLAQSAVGLSAIPPRLEVTGKPGEVVVQEIKIRNESRIVRYINTGIKDFIVMDDKGTPTQIGENLDQSQNRWAASNWISTSPSKFTLQPGETKSLMVSIIIPDDALSGGHYAVILHAPSREAVLDQTGASMETQVGTLVYITVPGDIHQDAQVKDFTVPSFSEYGPIDFKATVTNLSDVHIAPMGSVVVTNWLNGKTASLSLQSLNIFPFASREYNNTLNKKFLFGRYKAQFLAAYGTAGNVASATAFFWVIPWRLILLVIASIIIIIVLIVLLRQQSKYQPPQADKINELEHELDDLKKKYKDRQ